MGIDLSRRSILFGRKPNLDEVAHFYPPWAVTGFTDQCTRCGDCLKVCPTQILHKGDGGFPEVDFQAGECTFCGFCRSACTAGALNAPQTWTQAISISSACVAQQGVDCRVCGESCEPAAINFRLQIGQVAQPHLDPESCTGCGACIAPCPVQAISIQHR